MLGLEMDPMSLAGRVAGRYYFNINAVIAMLLCLPGKKNERELSKVFGGNIEEFKKLGVGKSIPPICRRPECDGSRGCGEYSGFCRRLLRGFSVVPSDAWSSSDENSRRSGNRIDRP